MGLAENGDLAIITARGGSKRVPRKNIREFLGKPVMAYSIEAAIGSGLFSEVMVSTDDSEIADIARSLGASVPFMRSERTSDDFATTSEVLTEVVGKYEKVGRSFDAFCCIYPAAPFVTRGILQEAKELLDTEGADSVLPVVKFGFPPQRAFEKSGRFIRYIDVGSSQMRSQDLKPMYHDCGQFYYCRYESFRRYRNTVMPKTVGLERPEVLCQDIDTLEDWSLAELKYSYALEKGLMDGRS